MKKPLSSVKKACPACKTAPKKSSVRLDVSEETLYDLADLFKVFGDGTRIRILSALFESERCVHQIADELKMTHSAISHQLRFLKQSKLVKNRREGKTIVYALADEHVKTIFNQGLKHVKEDL